MNYEEREEIRKSCYARIANECWWLNKEQAEREAYRLYLKIQALDDDDIYIERRLLNERAF